MRPLGTTLMLLTPLAVATLWGCVGTSEELEPRPDTRPMVGQIRQAHEDWAWIAAQQWYLSSIEGLGPIEDTELRISFKEHTWLEGDAGCNRFTASYTRRGDSGLKVTEVMSTKVFCARPEGIMQQEARFLHLLQSVNAYHAEPDRLDLYVNDSVVLSFAIRAGED